MTFGSEHPQKHAEPADETVFDVMNHQKGQPMIYRENKLALHEVEEPDEEPNVDNTDRCGILCFKPDWLQKFRNLKVFLLVFIVTGITQSMYYSYWNMSLSSIEKRLQIPSRTTGIITAINDVSHIAVVLLVAHFCGKGHRPRYLAMGSLLLGFSVLLFATPELLAPKWDAENMQVTNLTTPKIDRETCLSDADALTTADKCDAESQTQRGSNLWPLLLLGLAQTLLGIATTAPIVLAMPFIDDNVSIRNAPIFFALGLAGRFIGPLIGVFLGSYCLNTYVDLTKSPKIAPTDPRWMGAWYLGFIVIGTLIICSSTLYWFFPRNLSKQTRKNAEEALVLKKAAKLRQSEPSGLKEKFATLPRDMKRLLTNKVYMCRLVNDCIDMLVVSGYFNFSSKYIEFHFRMSPAQAGKASGLSSILAMGCGAAVGGFLIRRFKLNPRQIAIGLAVSSFLTAVCYFFLMMVRCEPRNLHSITGSDSMLLVDTVCSNGCNCAGKSFSPVCDELTQTNYYSPCHAGCSGSFMKNDTRFYQNCKCLANVTQPQWVGLPSDRTTPTVWSKLATSAEDFFLGQPEPTLAVPGTVKRGFCEGGCSGFWTYVAISASFKFIGMLPFSGNTMLSFRIVEPDLKSLSKAFQTMAASLFAFIPGPIIMGALIDSCCRLWNTQTCGKRGACLIYDLDGLRYKMHLYVGVIKTLACLMDLYVIYKVKDLKFEREPVKPSDDLEPQGTITGSIKDLTAAA